MDLYDGHSYDDFVKKTIVYEWWVEQIDEHDDIQDCGAINLSEWSAMELLEGCSYFRLCLRRLSGSEAIGLDNLGYSYFKNGQLEERFSSGHKVPARFLKINLDGINGK